MSAGLRTVDFWNMSYSEVVDTVEAYSEQQLRQQEIQAGMCYTLANLIGIAFNDPKKFPRTLQEAYPFVRKPVKRATWRESKEEFAAIAAAHNKSMRR